MGGRAIQPPQLATGFWSRPEVGEALRARDFGALFRLVSKWAGASQTQIAIAVGMSQSQVSNIMSGGRRVTAIDVSERVLDGLQAPDAARVAFGLAPEVHGYNMAAASPAATRPRSADTGPGGPVERAVDDDVRRRDVLQGAVLGAVTVGDAAGGGSLVRIARVLTSYPLLTGASGVDGPVLTVGKLAAGVARAKRDYQGCRYGAVLELLPGLLESARSASQTAEGDELLRVYALAADAYQVAGSVMLKFGDVGLAALAADRSMDAAARSEDPVTLAASARAVTYALMAGGHAERAKEIAVGAAKRFGAQVARPDDEALSVYGALVLRGAVAAAINEDRTGALELLDEAGEAGRRLGRDDNAHWTAFGPTNVQQHRVNIALRLGDAGAAVDLARGIDVTRIPIVERKASLFIDVAQAYVQWGKYDPAYRALRMADGVAREEVRTLSSVHRLIGDLAERAPSTVRANAREFATQIGVEL